MTKNYEVYYAESYIAGGGDDQLQLWSTHYEESNDNDNYVYISVDIEPKSIDDFFQIKVNPFSLVDENGDDLPFASQILKYKAIDAVGISPAPPLIKAVDNLRVVPPDDNSEDPTKIQFDLTWDAIENGIDKRNLDDILENQIPNDPNNRVYYELLIGQTPQWDIPGQEYEVIRIYEMYKDAGVYKLRQVNPDPADPLEEPFNLDVFRNRSPYAFGYNIGTQEIRADEIVIYGDDAFTPKYITPDDPATLGAYIANVTDDGVSSFNTNGVNYLRMRVITQKDGNYASSQPSAPVSLTLNTTKREIPIVEGFNYDPVFPPDPASYDNLNNLISIELDWPKVDIEDYNSFMLEPLDKNLDVLEYMVYISENKELLHDLEDPSLTLIEEAKDPNGRVLIDEVNLDGLRNDQVVFFPINNTDYPAESNITVPIDGLDLNNTYYARIIVKLSIDDEPVLDVPPLDKRSRSGEPSAILAITVPIIPPEPGPDEILPLAPEQLVVDYLDVTGIPTTLEWIIPDEITVELNTYGFEVFAIEEVRLPENTDNSGVDPTGLITEIGNHSDLTDFKTEAYRIYYEGTDVVLKKYDGTNWIAQMGTVDEPLLKMSDGAIWMVDEDNSPNRVIYYYVRTINVEAGEPIAYSPWIEGTITSKPVQPPVNLIVDHTQEVPHDSNDELVIRFDAPVDSFASVDSDYYMEIYIKGEMDDQFVLMSDYYTGIDSNVYSRQLIKEDDFKPVGYVRVYYLLRGLKAGKSYEIKVRIQDRTKDPEVVDGEELGLPVSKYSETVVTRTLFSQEDYDKEQKYKQYIDYYIAKSEELSQKPYYQLETTDTVATAKYRTNYADGLVRISRNQTYEMVAFEKKTNVYYIPSDLLTTANDYNVTFYFEPQGQSVAIHPYSIGKNITNEINLAIKDINEYDSEIEDYYIMMLISVGTYTGTINGQEPSSDMVNIQMSIIPSKMDEEDMDIALEVELNRIVNLHKSDLIERLDDELELGINDVKLTTIVQDILGEVETDFNLYGQRILDDQLVDQGYEVRKVNKNVTVGINSSEPDSSNILYARTTGGWEVKPSTYYNQRYHIESKELGSFLSVKQAGSEILGDIYTTEQLNILNKYNLSDVFTNFELKNPNSTIYNEQMIRTFARLMGANNLEDTIDYLRDSGLDVPYLNSYSKLNREIANYLYVQAYAKKNQINLDAVVIRDYNEIEDINLVKAAYRETLLKGVSLGIIGLEQGHIMPSKDVTILEFFELIDNIE